MCQSMKVVQDKKSNKWLVLEKQCVYIGKLMWVIVSTHDTEQKARGLINVQPV